MPLPEIKPATHTATLASLTLAHVNQRYVDWLNDPDVSQFLETRHQVQTLATVTAFVTAAINDPDVRIFAIMVDGRHIGNIKIGPINRHHDFADISYFIGDKSEWGKGYCTEAVKIACAYAFNGLKLHRLQAGCYAKNRASCKVLVSCGFAKEGEQRRKFKTEHGWDDHCMYGRCSDQVAM